MRFLYWCFGVKFFYEKDRFPDFICSFALYIKAKIEFVSYNSIHDIFCMNDFNWNVMSSTHRMKNDYDKLILDIGESFRIQLKEWAIHWLQINLYEHDN